MMDAALLIELALKSVLVAGGTLGLLRLARNRSAAERSWIGHLGLIALVLLPAASLLMPGWNPLPATAIVETAAPFQPPATAAGADLATTSAAVTDSAVAAPAPATWSLPSAGEVAIWVYAIPLALLLTAMLIAILRLGAMHRRANVLVEASWLNALAQAQRRMGFKHGTALLVSDELRSPVSWGLMRPIILLNPQAVSAVEEAEAIIAHELAHVARFDWAKLLIARLACALFWFNPLVWRLARESHQLREEAADDAVLLSEVDGAEYASLLVNAARHDNRALLIAAHGVAPGKDSLKRRITRVLDADLARAPANGAWVVLCLVALVAVAAPLAAFDPTAARAATAVAAAKTEAPVALVEPRPAAVRSPVAVASAVETPAPTVLAEPAAKHAKDERDDEIDTIIASKAVGLSPEYIGAMRAAGFTGSVDDLTGARAVGVTPEFARQMRRYDSTVDLDTVIAARATGLSGTYFSEMRRLFPGLTLDDAVGMSALGVTLDYARQMRRIFPRASADDMQSMRALGVTPEFVREMRRQGISADDPEEAIEGRLFSSQMKGPRGPVGPGPGLAATVSTIGANVALGIAGAVSPPSPSAPPEPPAPPGD
jgi:beta-lactamase regulating signal transducer with metallopeptidase domain